MNSKRVTSGIVCLCATPTDDLEPLKMYNYNNFTDLSAICWSWTCMHSDSLQLRGLSGSGLRYPRSTRSGKRESAAFRGSFLSERDTLRDYRYVVSEPYISGKTTVIVKSWRVAGRMEHSGKIIVPNSRRKVRRSVVLDQESQSNRTLDNQHM